MESDGSNGQKASYWTINDFEIGSSLGKGRFGNVFLAREKRSHFLCALKVISKNLVRKYQLESQLKLEIEIHFSIDDPNVVRLYGYFFDEAKIYLILEYAPRGALSTMISKRRYFEEPLAAKYFVEISKSIQCIHSKGIIHRDLKPSNILLSLDSSAMLSDFGFSRYFPSDEPDTSAGTMDYLAPELLSGGSHSFASDIWSLGVILYEMLVGVTPFEADDRKATAERIVSGMFSLPSHVSPLAAGLLSSILVVEPSRRPAIDRVLSDPWLNLFRN